MNYNKTGETKILKPEESKGYLRVKLCKNRKVKRFLVHHLVAQAFVPNIFNLDVVNHINEVKKDDILLDLHFNSALKEDVSGVEVFIPSDYTDIEKKLAETLLKTVTETLQIKSRGVKTEGQSQHSRLGILHLPCTTVLLEVCFLTNKNDVYKYKEKRGKLAEKIAKILL